MFPPHARLYSPQVFTGFLSLINGLRAQSNLTSIGWVNKALYESAANANISAGVFNDVTQGHNACCSSSSCRCVCLSPSLSSSLCTSISLILPSPALTTLHYTTLLHYTAPAPAPAPTPAPAPAPAVLRYAVRMEASRHLKAGTQLLVWAL